MTAFLVFLLAWAVVALAFLSFYIMRLRARAAGLDTGLITLQARYDADSKHWNDFSTTVKAKYQGLVNKYNEDAKKWNEFTAALKGENQRLSKWKNVADAEVKATEMLRAAQAMQDKAKTDADNLIAAAQQKADSLQAEAEQRAGAEIAAATDTANKETQEAKAKAKSLRDEAQENLHSVTIQAASIVEAANIKAKEIAGSAYEAMKNASLYEQTIKAIKNAIEGYGNQYIIPPHSLLDNLAEDFSYTQAGRDLKRARDCTKIMVRNGTAAACQYVEANRQETAINFVIDAFTGKVDSVLSRVKHDNAGKLEQEIRDAFTLVNYNGKAFREARITEEYLAARLELVSKPA